MIVLGDVDSGDDNESERHSNQSSNRTTNQNSQRRLHGPTINSRNNFHNHGQPSLPSTSAQSPLSHQHQSLQQRAILTAAASAAAAAASVPNYMNISSNSGGAIGKAINNLDLICGVVDAAVATSSNSSGSNSNVNVSLNNSLGAVGGVSVNSTNNVLNRQMRLRVYGNGKGGMVRHETKL